MKFKTFLHQELHSKNSKIWWSLLITFTAFILSLTLLVTAVICDLALSPNTGNNFYDLGSSVGVMKDVSPSSSDSNTSKPPSTGKKVALTLDDGPYNVYTPKIVDELNKYGFHATFFVVGNRIDGSSYNGAKSVKYVLDNGNEVGIHGYTHSTSRYYDECSEEIYQLELNDTLNAIHSVDKDYEVKLMRPVGGRITQTRIEECDYSVIMWSVDSLDWKYQSTAENVKQSNIDAIVSNVMSGVEPGSIILMHDLYENTYEALKIILKRLYDEGYEVVTVSELLGDPKPGVKYSSR